jgi:23S rRNA pseudouridine1911/1915/1917 synthase
MGEMPANYSVIADGKRRITVTVPDEYVGLRLDQVLARLLPEYSRSRLARWVREQQITLDGRTAVPSEKLRGEVIYEDDTLLVVNKPPGLVVHPGSGNWDGTLLNALLKHAPRLERLPRAGIVHRLDKDTSGLLVVAKTLVAQTDLVRQLQARTVTRSYLALVHGRVPRDGKVDAPIGRHPAHRTRMAVVARGKPAITHYEIVERYETTTLLRCRLETGRTHQIRVHLNSIGYPLVGDPVYGKKRPLPDALRFERQALHADKLVLVHPATRRERTWRAALPDDFRELLAAVKKAHEHA